MNDSESEVPKRERVAKAMLGVYDTAKEIDEHGSLPSLKGSSVRELIRVLESGATRFDVEIDSGLGQKYTLQELIEKIIDTCFSESETIKSMAGQKTDQSEKFYEFAQKLKTATYGDLTKNKTIH